MVPRLKISMKSCVYVAPLFPPPPYTWLMTRSGETAEAGAAKAKNAATVKRSARMSAP